MCQCQTAIISLLSCNLLLWLSALLPLKMIVHLFAFYLFEIQYITNWHTGQSPVFLRGLSICLSFIALIMRDLWTFIMCNPMSRPDLTQHPGRCAYGSCRGESELKIPCALVKEKSRCALTKCHLGRWDKGRMRTCQEMQGGIFWNDFSEVFNAGGRFEKMHFFSLHNSFRVSYKEKSWLEVWSSRIWPVFNWKDARIKNQRFWSLSLRYQDSNLDRQNQNL